MEFVKKGDQKSKFDLGQRKVSDFNNFNKNSHSSHNSSNPTNFQNFSNSFHFSNTVKKEEVSSSNIQKKESVQAQEKVFSLKNDQEDFSENKKFLSFLEKLITTSIFFLVAGLPLFFLNLTYQGINFEKQYFFYFWILVGIVAWGTKIVLSGSFVFQKTPLDWALLVFLIIYSFATLFSVDRYHSFFGLFIHPINGLISVFALFLTYYFLVMNINYSRAKKLIFMISGVGSLISIWVSIIFILALFKKIPLSLFSKIPLNLLGFSFFSLATYLVFLIPLIVVVIYLIDESSKKNSLKNWINFALYFVLFTIFFNISILFNFVYWVSFLIAFGVFVIFVLGKVVVFSPKIFYTSLAVFLISVTFFVIKIPLFENNFLQNEDAMSYKVAWEITQNSVKNKPFLGSGPGTYGYDFSLFRPKSQSIEGWDSERFYLGKGLFFENLATIGILGTISAMALVLLYIGYFFHNLNRFSHKNKVLSLGFFVANLTIIFSAITGFLDGSLIFLSVFMTALSINVIQKEAEIEVATKTFSLKTSPQHALLNSFLFLVIIVGIIFGLVNFSKMFLADFNIKKALVLQSEKDDVKASEYFSKSLEKNEKEGNYYNILSVYCFNFLNNNLNSEQKQSSICTNNLTQFALLSAKLMPDDVRINQMAGFIVYKSGYNYVSDSLNEARKLYQKSLELEPKNPFFEIALGEINLTEAQIGEIAEENLSSKKQLVEDAKKLFETAKDKFTAEDQYIPIYEKISMANENLGNIDEAIKNLEVAIEKNGKLLMINNDKNLMNQQMNYGFNLARLLIVRATGQNNQNSKKDFDEAENLLKQILQINDKETNTLLSLGLLYEKTNRIDEAISQYNKILEILPAENKSREQVQKLIDNLNSTKTKPVQ